MNRIMDQFEKATPKQYQKFLGLPVIVSCDDGTWTRCETGRLLGVEGGALKIETGERSWSYFALVYEPSVTALV
jgi:hypothetical protein